jgi:hypothetical protein
MKDKGWQIAYRNMCFTVFEGECKFGIKMQENAITHLE